MLSTAWPLWGLLIVSVSALALALIAAAFAHSAQVHADKCARYVTEAAAMDPNRAEIAKLSAEMTELTDSYQALLASHKKLRARIGMRKNREPGGGDAPTALGSITDKTELRLAAKQAGLLK